MSYTRILAAGAAVLLLAGCANAVVQRGECEFMLPTERDRCLRANESNREMVKERAKARSDADK